MYCWFETPVMLEALALALNESLQDEYKARATYRAIIQAFGPVRPFINIVEAGDASPGEGLAPSIATGKILV